jgi:fucose 4-O-acetylase-like acetyltransferase
VSEQKIASRQVTVGTAAVAIGEGLVPGSTFLLHADTQGNHDIFVGPLGVTISTGFAVHSGSTLTINVPERVQLYAVTNSGTHTLYVLQIGGR